MTFSQGGGEGERKLGLLEPRLIKITSVSRDKVNHPLCSSAENTSQKKSKSVSVDTSSYLKTINSTFESRNHFGLYYILLAKEKTS